MGGIVGRFMTSFGFTMSFAILVSLLVSFTLTPMLAARWIKMRPRREDAEGHEIAERELEGLAVLPAARSRLYRNPAAGRWRIARIIAGIAVLVLLSSVPLFMVANKNFLPNDDQSEFEVGLRAPEGTSLEATEIIANRLAARIRQLPEVAYTLVSIADDPARTQNSGTVYVRLTAGRGARARPVRGDERGAERQSFRRIGTREPAHRRPAGRDDRRRRQPERGNSVHNKRARPQGARAFCRRGRRGGAEGTRRRRRGHVAERREAGTFGATSTG